jgi:hypothetical protein
MGVNSKRPKRRLRANDIDLDIMSAGKWNDAAGADKVIVIEPVVVKAVTGAENIGAGKLVKVTGTAYTLDLVGRAYSATPNKPYQKGDIVTNTTFIYLAMQDGIKGTFDAAKWRKVITKTIGPVTITAGSVVSTGRWHNTVTANGFLVDDDSDISHQRVRD